MKGSLILMSMPPAALCETVLSGLREPGLIGTDTGWPVANWHQSLSDDHLPEHQAAIVRAMERVRAPSFELVFDRISSRVNARGHAHWTLHGRKSAGLSLLLQAVQEQLAVEGIPDTLGHTTHITLSYRAPRHFEESIRIAPVAWTVDDFRLVSAGGRPYAYTTIERWTLEPTAQGALF